MADRLSRIGQLVIVLIGAGLAAVLGWFLFVQIPDGNLGILLGVVLVLAAVAVGARVAGRVADSVFPSYDAAAVAVEGPITRDGGRPFPNQPGSTPADAIVEQIERANEDDNARALLLELNTPGGQVVPSDDIRLAAAQFDGPTVAYATDVCASGGYWIASGCDELYARDGSIVGSIGVIGSRVNAKELADKLGLTYERLAAGRFKDAGMPLKEFDEEEREYLQGIIDEYYENFVERVVEGRDLDPGTVRGTEARVYLGEEALELGLVDALGTREDVEDRLAAELGVDEITVKEFKPAVGLAQRLRRGGQSVAYAFGAGVASALHGEAFRFELR